MSYPYTRESPSPPDGYVSIVGFFRISKEVLGCKKAEYKYEQMAHCKKGLNVTFNAFYILILVLFTGNFVFYFYFFRLA
jgi:hypothetical protein